MNIGENIKTYRKEKGLTQEQLGNLSGLSKNAIYNYENNKRVPNITTIYNISNALEVSLDELLIGKKQLELLIAEKQLSEFTTEELIKELYKRTLR